MRLLALALIGGLTSLPQAPDNTVRELIEKFRSGDLVAREEATRKLKELRKAAKAELEKAAKDRDGQVARLASSLVERLTLLETLSPRLQEHLPGLADKLAFGGDPAWTQAFLAVALKCGESSRLPILTRKEIEPLVSCAVRGAATEEDKSAVAGAINTRRLYKPPLDLMPLLEDPHQGIRWSVVEAVNRNPPETIVRRLIEGTRDENPNVRGKAIQELGLLRIERAIPEAVRLLKDEVAGVRATAVEALSDMCAKEKASEIIPSLKDGENRVKFAALEALGTLYAREAIPAVEERLKDEEVGIRREAVTTLADLSAQESIPKILQLLKDPEEEVRTAAIHALGKLVARDGIPSVKALLSDPENSVRNAAFYFLDDVDPNWALERLKDPDRDVRMAAATQLGEQGGPEAVAALVEALKDKDDYVCEEAAIALAKFGDRRGLATLNRLFKAGLPDQDKIIRALADLGAKEILPKAISRLSDKSEGTRMSALLSLHVLGAKEAAPKIEPLLKDPDVFVRQQAVFALAKLQERESLPRILPLLHDKSTMVVWAVLNSLWIIKEWDADDEVSRFLEDLEPRVRYHAANQLVLKGSTKGVPELLDQDELQYTALNALREPEVWRKLVGLTAPANLQGTRLQKIEKVAQVAGMRVVVEPAPLGDSQRTYGRVHRDNLFGPKDSLVAALWSLVPREQAMVLEKDRIRLMDQAAGQRFWREWWKDHQASKK